MMIQNINNNDEAYYNDENDDEIYNNEDTNDNDIGGGSDDVTGLTAKRKILSLYVVDEHIQDRD